MILRGYQFGDVLIGGISDDTLTGAGGDDVLEGGAGGDSFDGGDGFDTVSFAGSAGSVTVSDFFLVPASGDAAGDTYTGIEAFVGSDLDDTFALTTSAIVEGGGGADTFYNVGSLTVSYEHSNAGVTVDLSGATASTGGDAEGDTLFGVTGLFGSRYGDTLMGADANDVLKGYGGRDTITGGAGDDTIAVTGQWAAIDGGDGFDRLHVRGSGGLSTIVPDVGALSNIEKVVVASGTVLDLGQQSEIDGVIKLNSRSVDLTAVFGTGFDDRIVGGAGSDFIVGAGGRDRFTGGQGGDVFGFFSAGPRDVITDFSGHNGDRDVIALLGVPPVAFVETFSGNGAAEVRTETRAPGVQFVFFDGDGDGNADASVRVMSADALTADDFFNQGTSNIAHTDGFAQHPAFAEALLSSDIVGLV